MSYLASYKKLAGDKVGPRLKFVSRKLDVGKKEETIIFEEEGGNDLQINIKANEVLTEDAMEKWETEGILPNRHIARIVVDQEVIDILINRICQMRFKLNK
jgi:hypothetical protein